MATAIDIGGSSRRSEPEELLCTFERDRLRNIRINQKMMKSLGIFKHDSMLWQSTLHCLIHWRHKLKLATKIFFKN